jgi:uroporphyrinogen decarboxylase
LALTSLERVRKAVAFEEPDSVPVGPYVANHTARLAGMKIKTYCTNGREMARANLEAWERYGYDIIFPDCDNYYMAEGLGIKTDFPEDDIPNMTDPPLQEMDEVFDLQVPDPLRDGRMPVILEALSLIKEQVREEAAVRVPGTGPFAMASYLIGIERFLLELAKVEYDMPGANPDALFRMLEVTTDTLIAFGNAEIDAGADIVQCGDSLASINVISPAMYKKYALPYEQKAFEAWKKRGVMTLLHICGNSTKVLDLYAETGADIVELDSAVDLAYAKQKIGGRVCLCGNISPVATFFNGTPADVEREARECIRVAAPGSGYILGSGCEIPMDTPPENIEALVRTGREYSYPLSF